MFVDGNKYSNAWPRERKAGAYSSRELFFKVVGKPDDDVPSEEVLMRGWVYRCLDGDVTLDAADDTRRGIVNWHTAND